MSAVVMERARERLRRLATSGYDMVTFCDEAGRALGDAVASGTPEYPTPTWYALDPDSLLITSMTGPPCSLDIPAQMRWEYVDQDYNKSVDVGRHPRGVQTLHEVTGGRPERSPIYRDYMREHDLAQEMLVALRSRQGALWGTVRIIRSFGQPEFCPTELDFMASVAPLLAEGIQRALLLGEATEPDHPDAPGLVTVGLDGTTESITPMAEVWLSQLCSDWSADGRLPLAVHAVASAALGGGGTSTSRARTAAGRWVTLYGVRAPGTRPPTAAVIIEPAHPARIAPLLMSLYGLTNRERQLTQLAVQGWSTNELARRLDVSPYTVQEHLKSIFDKTGVRSRQELVGKIFFDHYEPRVIDNDDRVRNAKPVRGGPYPP